MIFGKIKEIESKSIPYWYPSHRMMNVEDNSKPWGVKWRAGTANFRTVAELFTKRNLWALAKMLSEINSISRTDLRIIFTWAVLKCSIMMRFCEDGIGRITSGSYYIPQIRRDSNVLNYFEEAIGDVIRHHQEKILELHNKNLNVCISTQDSKIIKEINDNSIDYIFTDPSYSDKVQYGEMNFIWESWLNFDTRWHKDEIIVNDIQGKSKVEWAAMMLQAMKECYRVLKPGRWISLCYHDTSEGTWALLQDLMAEAGFIVDDNLSALFIDTSQKTMNQILADKVNRRDLVINFRKPRAGEVTGTLIITGEEDSTTFSQKVTAIIRDYLIVHPGMTKDRIYDEVVSRMVRAGQMEAHNFEEILGRVAEPNKPEGSTGNGLRWYLKETELNALDSAETIKEDTAYEKMATFVTEFLQKHPENEGVHYSDLFENYIYAVKDKPAGPWLTGCSITSTKPKKEPTGFQLPMKRRRSRARAGQRESHAGSVITSPTSNRAFPSGNRTAQRYDAR